MLNCREVTRLVASDEIKAAGWGRRLSVRLHLFTCRKCRRYVAQLRALGVYARNRWGQQPALQRSHRHRRSYWR